LCNKIINHPAYPILRSNPPVHRELSFIWKLGRYLIQGTVDAILADGTLVDYKTGNNARNYAERYWKQLEIYYYAMKDLGINLNNKLILLYIDQQQYDIKEVEVSQREVLETEIYRAIENYMRNINQDELRL